MNKRENESVKSGDDQVRIDEKNEVERDYIRSHRIKHWISHQVG